MLAQAPADPQSAGMKTAVVLVLAALVAGCADPAPAPPPTAAAETREPEPEPAPAPPPPKPGKLTSITIEQIFPLRLEDKVLMVDVRREFFYQLGHIDGAIHLPLVDFEAAYPAVKPQLDAAVAAGRVIVLYCQSETCPDSHTTAEALADRGYDVCVYRGGWDEWKAVGVE